jgi:DNA-binding transcriptional LysR family regulator
MSQSEPRLKTRWLQHFILLCEAGDWQQGAKKAGVSRKTLQRSLKELEICLGTSLLQKQNQSLQPTPAGQHFLKTALAIQHALQKLTTHCLPELSPTDLVLAWQSASSFSFLPRLLSQFIKDHPTVFLRVHCQIDTQVLSQQLSTGEIDLAVMDAPPSEVGLQSTVIARSPFVIVSAPRPLCHWSALTYILPQQPSPHPDQKRWDEQAYPREIIATSNSLDMIIDWCTSARAATFLPQITVQHFLDTGQLAIVATPPEAIQKEIFLVYAESAAHRPEIKALHHYLKVNV